MKKGFTLIELLAVVIVLSLIMVIAVPYVMKTLNDSRKKTFDTQAKSIWQSAEKQYLADSMRGIEKHCYGTGELDLATIAPNVSYYVNLDENGKVVSIKVQDPVEKFIAEGTSQNGITITSDRTLTTDTPILKCDEE